MKVRSDFGLVILPFCEKKAEIDAPEQTNDNDGRNEGGNVNETPLNIEGLKLRQKSGQHDEVTWAAPRVDRVAFTHPVEADEGSDGLSEELSWVSSLISQFVTTIDTSGQSIY